MAYISLHRDKFREYLKQFSDDVPFQIELVKQLLDQIPPNAVEGFITEYFYEHGYFKGKLYKIQHLIYKDDIHYFTDKAQLLEFLQEYYLDRKLSDALTESRLNYFIRVGQPVAGYLITEVSNGRK